MPPLSPLSVLLLAFWIKRSFCEYVSVKLCFIAYEASRFWEWGEILFSPRWYLPAAALRWRFPFLFWVIYCKLLISQFIIRFISCWYLVSPNYASSTLAPTTLRQQDHARMGPVSPSQHFSGCIYQEGTRCLFSFIMDKILGVFQFCPVSVCVASMIAEIHLYLLAYWPNIEPDSGYPRSSFLTASFYNRPLHNMP